MTTRDDPDDRSSVDVRRSRLLLTFGVMALVPVLVLGIVLSGTLEGVIRSRALENARTSSAFVAGVGVPAYVPARSAEEGLTRGQVDRFESVVKGGVVGKNLAGIEIRNRAGRLVFSDRRADIGKRSPAGSSFRRVLQGEVVSRVTHARAAHVLEVSLPLRYPTQLGSSGVVTVYLPYGVIAGTIARDTRKLYLILAVGLGVLYLLLFPVVAFAASRLRRQAVEHERLAHHDALTELPNRILFTRRLEEALAESRTVAVLIADIDRFKDVNDRYGHLNGDKVLRHVAARLGDCVRGTDTVARLGGDEFGILLPGATAEAAEQVASRITDAMTLPLMVDGRPVRVLASIGIVSAPQHGTEYDGLLHVADFAMSAAKQAGSGYRIAGPAPVRSAAQPIRAASA